MIIAILSIFATVFLLTFRGDPWSIPSISPSDEPSSIQSV